LDRVDEARDLLVGAKEILRWLDEETREDELAQMRSVAMELAEALDYLHGATGSRSRTAELALALAREAGVLR